MKSGYKIHIKTLRNIRNMNDTRVFMIHTCCGACVHHLPFSLLLVHYKRGLLADRTAKFPFDYREDVRWKLRVIGKLTGRCMVNWGVRWINEKFGKTEYETFGSVKDQCSPLFWCSLVVLPALIQYWGAFTYLFCLVFVDFILVWYIKIVQTLAINLQTSIDPS